MANSGEWTTIPFPLSAPRLEELPPDERRRVLDAARADLSLADPLRRRESGMILRAFVNDEPDFVWETLLRHAPGADEDLRCVLAICLLEPLLNAHFERIVARLEAALQGPCDDLARILALCWPTGQSRPLAAWVRICQLLKRHTQPNWDGALPLVSESGPA